VTQTLLIANVAVFLLQSASGGLLEEWFALWPPGYGFWIWQLVTYGFLHGGIGHIFFNMLGLYMFGSDIERLFGSRYFLFYYFACLVIQYRRRGFPFTRQRCGRRSSSPSSEDRHRKDQKDSGEQQQNQDDLSKARFVEPSVEFHSEPGAGQQHRQAEQKQLHRIGGDRAARTQPDRGHGARRDDDRLEDRALHVLRPAAQLAPYHHDDPDEAGQSAEQPVEKSDSDVGGNSALRGLERRSRQVIDA